MGEAQMSSIKDSTKLVLARSTCWPLTVILAQFKGSSVPIDPSDRHDIDVDMSINFEIGE